MDLSIEHKTRYQYSETVQYTIQQLRLTPVDGFGQRIKRWDIKVNGHLHCFEDTHGNTAHTLVLDSPHDEINIVASGEVETGLDIQTDELILPLEVYLRLTDLTELDAGLQKFAAGYARHRVDKTDLWMDDMMHAIIERVPYVKGITGVETTAATAFQLGTGVCQDHAHIFIACCRQLGIPARYVSGYLFTQDGSLMESHAWADVWREGAGWQSFDVSNGSRIGGHTGSTAQQGIHVRLAVGLDYRDACPVSGMRLGGGMETMGVSVQVNQSGQQQQVQQ